MQTRFRESCASLRSEDIRTGLIMPSFLEISMQWSPCFIHQINISDFLGRFSQMEQSSPSSNMGMLHEKVGKINDTASCPIAECKERLSTRIVLLDQVLQNGSFLRRQRSRRYWLGLRKLGQFHPTYRILGKRSLVINKPLTKVQKNRLHPLAVRETVSLSG